MSGTVRLGAFKVGRAWLAPMAGYTDIAFRTLCREYGAGLTVSEMVSARGLKYGSAGSAALLRVSECEKPSCVQLFGSEPDDFAIAASKLDCDIIDVNMGCPMPKIVRNGDGAALLNDPERAGRIVAALKNATDKPITVKTRLGYRTGETAVKELAESVATAGAAALTVHGRYAEQRYSGAADHSIARELASVLDIPVIVNGDIDDISALDGTPFAGAAIGRAALENPAVFSGGRAQPIAVARRHIALLEKYFDERYTVNQARKFFIHYFKGVIGCKRLRARVNEAESVRDVLLALDDML